MLAYGLSSWHECNGGLAREKGWEGAKVVCLGGKVWACLTEWGRHGREAPLLVPV